MNKKTNLAIRGMHCASCATLIEKSLKKLPGVSDVNVNFASEKASVQTSYKISHQALISAVKKAGYDAAIIDHADPAAEAKIKQHVINGYFQRFMGSGLLSLPMLYFMRNLLDRRDPSGLLG